VKQALSASPPQPKDVHGGPVQSDGVFAKSLGQLSLVGRPVETAYTPLKGFRRKAVPPDRRRKEQVERRSRRRTR